MQDRESLSRRGPVSRWNGRCGRSSNPGAARKWKKAADVTRGLYDAQLSDGDATRRNGSRPRQPCLCYSRKFISYWSGL